MSTLYAPARRSASTSMRRFRCVSTVLGMMTWMLVGHTPAASANPAADTANLSQSVVGAFTGEVPEGVCKMTATVIGGGGGSSPNLSGNYGIGGSGASVTATFDVLPGQTFDGIVGGGGTSSAGGASATPNGVGGAPGTVAQSHRGGGGGGRSTLTVAGATMIVAGGGGGSGAAHQATPAGAGGTGGFAGIAAGVAAVGTNGGDGIDPGNTAGGGEGGQAAAGGVGGINSGQAGANGFAGGAIGVGAGGNGGIDLSSDSGGGGGGGYTGGGGGSSTVSSQNSAGGGGGGSSYVAATSPTTTAAAPTSVAGVAGPASPGTPSAPGQAGSVKLDFVPCAYDLGIVKKVSSATVNAGGIVTWTIEVTNNGPAAMTKGDTIELADTLPVGPNGAASAQFKVTNITATGGSNTELASGPIACTGVVVGATMPAATTCTRAYDAPAAPGGPTGGVRGLDVGEKLTITYEQVISNTAPCQKITNSASVVDRSTLTAGPDVTGITATKTANTDLTINCYDLIVTQSPPAPTVFPSGTINWSVTITNPGPGDMAGPADSTANPLKVTAAFPSGIGAPVLTSSTGSAGACTFSGTAISCPGSLPAGTSQTLTFTQAVPGTTPATTALTSTFNIVDPKTGDANDSSSATVTVILPALPTAGDDTGSGTAGLPFAGTSVLGNDTGTAIKVTSFTQPPNGTVTFNPDGSYTYLPNGGFSGIDTFTYTVTDAFGRTVIGTVTLKVYPATNPDSAATVVATPTDGGGLSLAANDVGTTLQITSNTNALHGVVVIAANGTYTYSPVAGYSGPDSFTYTVTDASGLTATETVTLLITPLAPNDAATMVANTVLTGPSVLGNDTGTGLVVDGFTQPSHGVVTMKPDGTYVYTPTKGFSGVDTFNYTALDATANPVSSAVTITVTPVATADVGATLADTTLNGLSISANDIGTGLTVTDFSQPAHGTVAVALSGTYVYTPAAGFTGIDTFTYTVTDNAGSTTVATVTITVSPRLSDDLTTTSASVPVTGTSLLTNDSGVGLVASFGTAPGHGNVVINGDGTYTYTPTDGYSGKDTFTYTVTDVNGLSSTGTVTVMVKPVAASNTAATTAGTPYNGASVLLNALGYGLSVASNTQPAHGTAVVHPDGTYTYTPAPGYTGADSFEYTIVDAAGQTVVQHVDVTITPRVVSDDGTTFMNDTLHGPSVLSNDSGTGLVIISHTETTHGTLTLAADGTYTYVPTARYIGQDSFTYTVKDANGILATTTVNIVVLPPQLAPAATPDRYSTGYETQMNGGSILSNDRGVEIKLQSWSNPSNGTLTMNQDGTFTYVPNPGFSGTDSFAYTIVDIAGRTSSISVVIEVGLPQPASVIVFDKPVPVDPAPVAQPTPAPTAAPSIGGTIRGTVATNAGAPVSGIRVILTCDGTEIGTTTSDPNYVFTNVPVGASCTIVVDESSLPPELRDHLPITSPTFVVSASGDTVVDVVVAPSVRSADAPAEPKLALTGTSTTPLALFAGLLLALGLLLMRIGRKRDVNPQEPARQTMDHTASNRLVASHLAGMILATLDSICEAAPSRVVRLFEVVLGASPTDFSRHLQDMCGCLMSPNDLLILQKQQVHQRVHQQVHQHRNRDGNAQR